MSRTAACLTALLIAGAAAASEKAEPKKETLTSGGRQRTYWLFAPERAPSDPPRPLLLLLHGSTRNGETLVKPWRDLAAKEGIVLAGPDALDPKHWSSPTDGPAFLRDVVEDVKARTPIDARRVLLFGHSDGACFALAMGAFESTYFAAVAIHAGSFAPQEFVDLDWASRKIPYAIWIGTRDAYFPLDTVRATRDALKARGFPVEYTEMPGHTHDYYGSSKDVNRMAWEFLKSQRLAADAKYTRYGESR